MSLAWQIVDDPITISLAAGIGAGCEAVAWRLSQPRGFSSVRSLLGAGAVNGFVCAAGAMIASRWLPESPLLLIGGAWLLAWLVDFSRSDTRERWGSVLFELAEMYLRSRRGRKDDPE